jgi:hypothetical protein
MAEHATPATCGVDHVGLSVGDLDSTRRFFCDCLGWRVVGERPEYPAAFVSDGQQIVTLWRVEAPDQAVAFDRRTNVGLHHLALAVADRAGLDDPALLWNSPRSSRAKGRRSISSCASRAGFGSNSPMTRASSGHAAAPPNTVINSRRCIIRPQLGRRHLAAKTRA